MQEKGDSINLVIPPSIEPGRYILSVRLVTSWDYAVIRISFNGVPLGQPVDIYTPVIDAKSVVLGTVEVKSGVNKLTLEAVAQNPESTGYNAGIGVIMLAPARQAR